MPSALSILKFWVIRVDATRVNFGASLRYKKAHTVRRCGSYGYAHFLRPGGEPLNLHQNPRPPNPNFKR